MNATTLQVAEPSSAVSRANLGDSASYTDACLLHATTCLALRQAIAAKDQDAMRRLLAGREATLATLTQQVPATLDEAVALAAAALAERPEPTPTDGPEELWFRDIANLLLELHATRPEALRLA